MGLEVLERLSSWDPDKTAIERTKNGLILVMISLVLGAIPIISTIAWILAILGIILLIFGRDVFEPPHSSCVVFAVIMWFTALLITFIGGFFAATDIAKSPILGVSDLVLTGFLDTVVVGIAYILLSYALQNRTGRILLYAAYATGIVLSILVLSYVGSRMSNPSSLGVLPAELQLLQLLYLIPNGIFAIAYYNAYHRIDSGEIPPSQKEKLQSIIPEKGSIPKGYSGD